jgi:hypothetical protein
MRTGTFYEINVSKNGQHLFATDASIRQYDVYQVLEMLNLFREKFPKSEGFDLKVTTWHAGCPKLDDDDEWCHEKFVEENWNQSINFHTGG